MMHYTEKEDEREREREQEMRATGQIMSISTAYSQIPRMKGTLPNQCIFSVYVIISLNIITVLQPTAACFKGSLVSWPRAQLASTHQHLSSFPFFNCLAPFLSHSGTVQQCQFCPRLTDHRKKQHF